MKVRRLFVWSLALAVLSGPGCLPQEPTRYTRTLNFGTARLTYQDFEDLRAEIVNYLAASEKSIVPSEFQEEFSVEDKSTGLKIDGSLAHFSTSPLPPVSYSLSYTCKLRDGRISRVTIYLNDAFRTAEISGQSRELVDGLASIIATKVGSFGYGLGGQLFRIISGLIANVLLIALMFLIADRKKYWISWVPLVGIIMLWVLPWDRWLPGCAIYARDAPLLVRNAALISFGSFLFGAVSIVTALMPWRRPSTKPVSPSTNEIAIQVSTHDESGPATDL